MVALLRRHPGEASRAALFLLSVAFALQGFIRYRGSSAAFDSAVLWLGLSLLCLALLSGHWRLPRSGSTLANALTLLRKHWLELVLLSAIIAFVASLRLAVFHQYPPSGVIFGEEGINGRVAYEILHGERPLPYPLTRYVSALGFVVFGENTTGLRLPFVLAGIVTVVPFYLLARELVRPPAALFATMLLGSSRLLIDPYNELDARILALVLFYYFLVRGLRTGSPLLLLGAGFLAGVLSYEWPAFSGAPLLAVGFLSALVVKGLLWPLPVSPSVVLQRGGRMVRSHWRSALAFVGAGVIATIPLVVAQSRGEGIYLHDLERHRLGASGLSQGLLATDWLTNLKWASEFFLPFGPRTFPSSSISDGLPLVDPVTGTLLASAVVFVALTSFRPYRALILGYFLVGMAGTALVADPFRGFRFVPFLPLGLILVGLVVDDVAAAVRRLTPWRFAAYAMPALLVGATVYASVSNVRAIFGTIIDDPTMPRVVFVNRPERPYALCDYLRDREKNSTLYINWDDVMVHGFTTPTDSLQEELQAFGDLAWVCGGLRGGIVAAPLETWPLHPAPTDPATVVFITDPELVNVVLDGMRKALPNKQEPTVLVEEPASDGPFVLVGYEFSADETRALQGLFGRYEALDGQVLEERVDRVDRLSWNAGDTPAPPFTVQWSGVAFLNRSALASLVAVSDDAVEVRVDGQISFSSLDSVPATHPRELLPGWHPIEVKVVKRETGGMFSLRWVDGQGQPIQSSRPEDFAPLRSLQGWRHRRTLASSGEPWDVAVTERFDLEPHFAPQFLVLLRALLNEAAPAPALQDARVLREEWSAVWHVPAEREYTLEAEIAAAGLAVTLDGALVIYLPEEREGSGRLADVTLRVPAGDHRIEMIQTPFGHWTGGTLSITDPHDQTYQPDLTPY